MLDLLTKQAGREALKSPRFKEFLKAFCDEQVSKYERITTDEMKRLNGSTDKAKQFAVRADVYETLIPELHNFAERDEETHANPL